MIWYPEALKFLQGKGNIRKEGKHALVGKTIADACETLIGASLLSVVRNTALIWLFEYLVTIFVNHSNQTSLSNWVPQLI
jgi:endoribonuclease Dicer